MFEGDLIIDNDIFEEIEAFECKKCGEAFDPDDEDHMSYMFKCGKCGNLFDDEEDAEDCCKNSK